MKKFALAIHGGAGTILKSHMTDNQEQAYMDSLKEALQQGERVLREGGTALLAVEEAVKATIRMHLHEGPGDILVFLTGSEECESATRLCEQKLE